MVGLQRPDGRSLFLKTCGLSSNNTLGLHELALHRRRGAAAYLFFAWYSRSISEAVKTRPPILIVAALCRGSGRWSRATTASQFN